MATSENDIRKAVVVLLQRYGSLNTSEVKARLEEVIPFDSDDVMPSKTRANETLIMQRIGNIVSHQKDDYQEYEGAYVIDKKCTPAQWTIMTGLKSCGTLRAIDDSEKRERRERNTFIPQKVDWAMINGQRTQLGSWGEEFVTRYETARILGFASDDVDRVVHLSAVQGDGAGYDILSLNDNGTERYIEVKTTQSGVDTPFYMSANERAFFESRKDLSDAFVYRVYNFNTSDKTGDVEIIAAADLFKDYDFDPISYKVTRK